MLAKTITIPATLKTATLYSVWSTVTESGLSLSIFLLPFSVAVVSFRWSFLGLPRFQSARMYSPVHAAGKIALVQEHSVFSFPSIFIARLTAQRVLLLFIEIGMYHHYRSNQKDHNIIDYLIPSPERELAVRDVSYHQSGKS